MGAAARRAAATRRLLDGPIAPTLLRLAAPNVVLVLAQTAVSVAETWYVGHLGTAALAGLALVFPMVMLMQMMSAGSMGGAVSSAVARALGAGNAARAEALVVHALVIAAGMAALFTVAMLTLGPAIFRALGGAGESLAHAQAYSGVVFAGALALWLSNTFASVLRGTGNMAVPAAVLLASAALQVMLAGALVLGWGPFPALGIAGAATAYVASFSLGALAMLAYLASGAGGLRLRLVGVPLRAALFFDILRVGALASLSSLQTSLTVVLVTGLVGGFGAAALAGYGLGARLEFLMVPIVFGIGAALTAMVGANVGAGQWARARRIAWTGAAMAAGATGAVGLGFGLFPDAWTGLFSDDPAVRAAGAAYLGTVGPCYAFFGLGMALYFASQGAGRMLWPVLAGTARLAIAVAGGWIAVHTFGGGLPALFGAIGAAMACFGLATAATVTARGWHERRLADAGARH